MEKNTQTEQQKKNLLNNNVQWISSWSYIALPKDNANKSKSLNQSHCYFVMIILLQTTDIVQSWAQILAFVSIVVLEKKTTHPLVMTNIAMVYMAHL